jgi:hypothetical protein
MLQRYWLGAVLALGVLTVPAHGQATLEWKFKPGETFFLEEVRAQKQTMSTPGKTFKQDLEQTTVFEITVKDVNPDKSVVLEQKVAGIQFKNAAGGGAEEKFIQQLQGAAFSLTLGPDGKPGELKGYDDVVKKIAGTDEQARKAVESILTKEALTRLAVEAFAFLPGKAVKDGDTWEQEFKSSLGPLGGFEVKRKYKYDGKETVEGKEYDKVTFTSATTYVPPKADDAKASAFLFTVSKADLKANNVAGYYYFAAGDGRLFRGEENLELTGTATLVISNQPVDTGVEQKQSVKLRVLDKNPLAK